MSKAVKTILEKIELLEAQKAELIALRKHEIFDVVKNAGGIGLDNRILAGLVLYAVDPANQNSEAMLQIKEEGLKLKFPGKRKTHKQ